VSCCQRRCYRKFLSVNLLLVTIFVTREDCQHMVVKELGSGEIVRLDRGSPCPSMNYVSQQMSVFLIPLRCASRIVGTQ